MVPADLEAARTTAVSVLQVYAYMVVTWLYGADIPPLG